MHRLHTGATVDARQLALIRDGHLPLGRARTDAVTTSPPVRRAQLGHVKNNVAACPLPANHIYRPSSRPVEQQGEATAPPIPSTTPATTPPITSCGNLHLHLSKRVMKQLNLKCRVSGIPKFVFYRECWPTQPEFGELENHIISSIIVTKLNHKILFLSSQQYLDIHKHHCQLHSPNFYEMHQGKSRYVIGLSS